MLGELTALDLSGLQGQFTGRILADLGMRVIKVEPPAGDPVRAIGPFAGDLPGRERSLRFAFLNGGKESVTLDITTAEGRSLLLDLVESSDVVIESFAPGTLEALGLGWETLRERNPRLVLGSVTGFGQDGPRAGWKAPDIVGVAMGGLMYISGDPELPPVRPPETQGYYYASVFAAYGILLALWGGGAQHVDCSIVEAVATQEHLIRAAAFDGVPIVRDGSQHKHAAPANIFPCKDGHVFLFVLDAPHWERLLELWPDHPAELDDEALRPPHNRRARHELINAAVESFTRRHTKAELVRLMQGRGIPCLPVNSPAEFLAEEQTKARGLVSEVTSLALGEYETLSFPVLFDGELPRAAGPPPELGADNPEGVV